MFLDGGSTMITAIGINSEIEFDQDDELSASPPAVANVDGSRPASDGGDAGGWAAGAASFHASQLNDRWGWGVALTSISGAILEHEDGQDFAGRYWATDVELLTITLLPSLSYKLTDDFSVGLGIPVMMAILDMDVIVPGAVAGAPRGEGRNRRWRRSCSGHQFVCTLACHRCNRYWGAVCVGAGARFR